MGEGLPVSWEVDEDVRRTLLMFSREGLGGIKDVTGVRLIRETFYLGMERWGVVVGKGRALRSWLCIDTCLRVVVDYV